MRCMALGTPALPATDVVTERRKRADLASSAGAGLPGFRLSALVAESVAGFALLVIPVGGSLHGWGTIAKHALERSAEGREPLWSRVLYWGCSVGLALLAACLRWALLR